MKNRSNFALEPARSGRLASFFRAALSAALSIGILFGCAGALPWNEQGGAGIARAEITYCPAAGTTGVVLCGARIVDGKERGEVSLEIEFKGGGKLKYRARAVRAFEAHEIRAAVERAVSADFRATVPDLADKIIKALIPGR